MGFGTMGLQESTSATWDLRTMMDGPTGIQKVFLLFLLVAFAAATRKLVGVWRAAPPFGKLRDKHRLRYAVLLQSSVTSLKHWSKLVWIAWGILASISVSDECGGLLSNNRVSSFVILLFVRDFSTYFAMALLVILFAFLVQWHVVTRAETFRDSA
jgi:hypothetical protein